MNPSRALVVALAVLVMAIFATLLYHRWPAGLSWYPGCLFHKVTGLHCPGCGMTRAAYATLHGDLGRAFRMNPVGMVLLPVGMMALALESVGWIRNRPSRFHLNVGPKGAWALAWLVIAFWILRNIPVWPFTLLAPR
jgi:hypothetical protein